MLQNQTRFGFFAAGVFNETDAQVLIMSARRPVCIATAKHWFDGKAVVCTNAG